MPITVGSTPATADATKLPSGVAPSAWAFSSLAITSAAAPSLIPLAFPAVTVPPARKAGLSAASCSTVVSGRGCSSRDDVADRDELVVEAARLGGCGPACLRARGERVLVLARDAVALGHVLAGLAHRLEREHRLHARIREAPAEHRVVDDLVAARERLVRLRHRERRAAHRLDAAGDEEVAVTRGDRVTRGDDGREARGAEPVDGHAGDGLRQPGEQRRHARDVAVVLTGLVRAAEVDVLDLLRRDGGPLDGRGDRERGEIVGAHAGRGRRRSGRSACERRRG